MVVEAISHIPRSVDFFFDQRFGTPSLHSARDIMDFKLAGLEEHEVQRRASQPRETYLFRED